MIGFRGGPRACVVRVFVAFAALVLVAPAASAHWVYCVHDRVRIESRSPEDVGRSHIASSICTLGGRFSHQSDARSFAERNFRGEGQRCACGAASQPANSSHFVYCVHGRVRLETRPPADLARSHIASSVCTLGSFRHASDARDFAQRNFRGEGQACACR